MMIVPDRLLISRDLVPERVEELNGILDQAGLGKPIQTDKLKKSAKGRLVEVPLLFSAAIFAAEQAVAAAAE
jgi:hypothetical protein